MSELKFTGLTVIVAVSLTAHAFNARASDSVPMTCEVSIVSPIGGRVEVTTIDHSPKLPFDVPLQIFWHPPALSPTIDLIVAYKSSFQPLSPARVARARFVPPMGADINKYGAEIYIEGGQHVRFVESDFDVGEDQGNIIFREDSPKGHAVLKAIDDKKTIKIIIKNADQAVASGTFETSVTEARDQLLAVEQHLIETSDPKYCKPI